MSPWGPRARWVGVWAAAGSAASRRAVGHLAGGVIAVCALAAFGTVGLLSGRGISGPFAAVAGISLLSGLACLCAPWDRIDPRWLHVIPPLGTLEVAVGVRAAGAYGDIAANYYVFVAVFAAYAFASRRAVAGHTALAGAGAVLPVLYHDHSLGHPPAWAATELLVIAVVATLITLLREGLQERQRELEELAVRDPLTGVGNYRLLTELLDHELARHRRSGASLSVLVLDLDGFKNVNDTLGHLAGDRALVEVAQALGGVLRGQDVLCRQGGDEFSIVAPETDAEQAARLAARIERAVLGCSSGALSTCVGCATFPSDAPDGPALLSVADEDLRRAKEALGERRRHRSPQATSELQSWLAA